MRKLTPALVILCLAVLGCGDGSKKDPPLNGDPNNTNVYANNSTPDMGGSGDLGGDASPGSDMGGGGDAGPIGDMGPVGETVNTTSGPVTGVTEAGIISFKGIPYAAPPLGDLRFRPPETHAGWDGPLDASEFGSDCPQRDITNGNDFGEEDCLFLNVWAPEGAQGLPVMVYIHGGGFVQGAGSRAFYDGTNLAERDVIVVTFNYRIGPLGFLAAEALAQETSEDTAGNYGLLDQIHALEWVQNNITAFGGDRDNVTLFGESAGGVSVCGHLGSPLSEGLFHRGIIQSGGGCGGYPQLRTGTLTTDPAVMIGAQFIAAVGCEGAADVAQCLRDVDALDTVDAAWSLTPSGLGLAPFGLVIDGTILPGQPVDRVRDGDAPDVPVMTGSTADEATLFTATTPVPTVSAYETYVNAAFGPLAGQILAIYPAADFATPKQAYNALFSDVAFICPALRFAGFAADRDAPAHTYHLTRVLPGPASVLGAFHGLDVFYVFGTFDATPNYTPNADDAALSEEMMSSWTSFATDGTLPWPAHDRLAPSIRIFDTTVETTDEIREGRCTDLVAIGVVP